MVMAAPCSFGLALPNTHVCHVFVCLLIYVCVIYIKISKAYA